MNIWHIDKIRSRTWRNSKSLKSALPNTLLCKLVLVTINITKIHGKHLCKDNMAFYKTHVELRIIATLIMAKMTKGYLLKQICQIPHIALF